MAKGEWIWIAESDDWCEKVFLETLTTSILKDAKCVLGYCQSYFIIEKNKIGFQSFHNKLFELVEGKSFIKEYMITKNSIFNASMAIWKKSTFDLVSKEFVSYKFCGDWLFWVELSMHGKVLISGQVLNFFRNHDKDVSTNFYRSGANFIEEIKAFNYFYNNKIIRFTDYYNGLETKYLAYKGVKKDLDEEKAKEIESLFFKEPKVRRKLIANYLKTMVKVTLKKFF